MTSLMRFTPKGALKGEVPFAKLPEEEFLCRKTT